MQRGPEAILTWRKPFSTWRVRTAAAKTGIYQEFCAYAIGVAFSETNQDRTGLQKHDFQLSKLWEDMVKTTPIDAPHSGLPTAFRNSKNGSVLRTLRPGENVARGLDSP